MNFFKTIKSQHLALLAAARPDALQWRLIGLLTIIILLTTGVVSALFGSELLQAVKDGLGDEADQFMPLLPWLVGFTVVFSVVFEFVWVAIVSFLTSRVLRYYKRPLSFTHIFNVYTLLRVYELSVNLALLLGMASVFLFTNQKVEIIQLSDGGVLNSIISLVVPILFLWLYIWSIRKVVAGTQTKIT